MNPHLNNILKRIFTTIHTGRHIRSLKYGQESFLTHKDQSICRIHRNKARKEGNELTNAMRRKDELCMLNTRSTHLQHLHTSRKRGVNEGQQVTYIIWSWLGGSVEGLGLCSQTPHNREPNTHGNALTYLEAFPTAHIPYNTQITLCLIYRSLAGISYLGHWPLPGTCSNSLILSALYHNFCRQYVVDPFKANPLCFFFLLPQCVIYIIVRVKSS